MSSTELITIFSKLTESLSPFHSHFIYEIDDIVSLKQEIIQKLTRLDAEEQKLSIGIMGQVKAGKSSFLNALLFAGRPVLPEAATPKTANLTRISYGDRPTLIVTYYSPAEWAEIELRAKSTGQDTEARVSRELVAMAAHSGVDINAALARGHDQNFAADIDGLIGILNDYAGENGSYTPLVKMTELQLPLDELKGFDVVDTPGMNDPVQSRTQKTKEYMAGCDVVFFLSRSAQFLDQSDMDLLARQLPGKGVKRMVLVAGQLDGALYDDGYDRSSLAETEKNIKLRLTRRADLEIEKLAQFRELMEEHDLAKLLRSIKLPIFASTYAHGFGSWEQAQWNKGMQHVHAQFLELAEDAWDGKAVSSADWVRIGNFTELTAAYHAARADKQVILQAQRDGLLPEMCRELNSRTLRLSEAIASRVSQLKTGSLSDIEAKQATCEHRIKRIANRLTEQMNKSHSDAKALLHRLRGELQARVSESASLNARTGTATETHSTEVSTSNWYNPFSWGSSKTVYYTTTRSYQYLAASDAIERVVNFGNENKAGIQRAFGDVINPAKLRADLRRALLSELETSSADFDPAEFRATLEGTLSRLKLPDLQIDLGDTSAIISSYFSGEVCGESEMSKLREALQTALHAISDRLSSVFSSGVETLCTQLDQIRDALGNELARDLREELKQLQAAFADKENELSNYAELQAIIQSADISRLNSFSSV